VNLYSIHNHCLLHQVVPPHLLVRPYVVEDDIKHRIHIAGVLRSNAKKDKDLQDGKEVDAGEEDQTPVPNEGPTTRQPTGRVTSRVAAQIEARTRQLEQLTSILGLEATTFCNS
jgi:hypothetical protein